MSYHDYRDYPQFYDNTLIKLLSHKPKWTISATKGDYRKMPVNFKEVEQALTDGQTQVHGANYQKADQMTTLDHLLKVLPDAVNHAYYLDSEIDGIVVLDIEKECPDEIKQRFLRLPYLYAEHSLSGTGIHLICKLPNNWDQFPEYHNKVKLRQKYGWYELLLKHWVTFTRNSIEPLTSPGTDPEHYTIANVYADLCHQTEVSQSIKATPIGDRPDIPQEKRIIAILQDEKYNKKLTDFPQKDKYGHLRTDRPGDYSAYEFGYTSYMYHRLQNILQTFPSLSKIKYTKKQLIYLLSDIMKQKLPYRPKHDTYHLGMPWLIYNADMIVNNYKSKAKRKQDQSKTDHKTAKSAKPASSAVKNSQKTN